MEREEGGHPGVVRQLEDNGMVTGESQSWTVVGIWRNSTQSWCGTVQGNVA